MRLFIVIVWRLPKSILALGDVRRREREICKGVADHQVEKYFKQHEDQFLEEVEAAGQVDPVDF